MTVVNDKPRRSQTNDDKNLVKLGMGLSRLKFIYFWVYIFFLFFSLLGLLVCWCGSGHTGSWTDSDWFAHARLVFNQEINKKKRIKKIFLLSIVLYGFRIETVRILYSSCKCSLNFIVSFLVRKFFFSFVVEMEILLSWEFKSAVGYGTRHTDR